MPGGGGGSSFEYPPQAEEILNLILDQVLSGAIPPAGDVLTGALTGQYPLSTPMSPFQIEAGQQVIPLSEQAISQQLAIPNLTEALNPVGYGNLLNSLAQLQANMGNQNRQAGSPVTPAVAPPVTPATPAPVAAATPSPSPAPAPVPVPQPTAATAQPQTSSDVGSMLSQFITGLAPYTDFTARGNYLAQAIPNTPFAQQFTSSPEYAQNVLSEIQNQINAGNALLSQIPSSRSLTPEERAIRDKNYDLLGLREFLNPNATEHKYGVGSSLAALMTNPVVNSPAVVGGNLASSLGGGGLGGSLGGGGFAPALPPPPTTSVPQQPVSDFLQGSLPIPGAQETGNILDELITRLAPMNGSQRQAFLQDNISGTPFGDLLRNNPGFNRTVQAQLQTIQGKLRGTPRTAGNKIPAAGALYRYLYPEQDEAAP